MDAKKSDSSLSFLTILKVSRTPVRNLGFVNVGFVYSSEEDYKDVLKKHRLNLVSARDLAQIVMDDPGLDWPGIKQLKHKDFGIVRESFYLHEGKLNFVGVYLPLTWIWIKILPLHTL